MSTPVAVIGAGSFGTCLALLAAREHDVQLWARGPEVADAINRDHANPHYLSDVKLPDRVTATSDLGQALDGREIVILAVPSHGVREVMTAAADLLDKEAIVVSTVKGIEVDTCMTMEQVLLGVLNPTHHPKLVFLSGPSFAREIADGKPTMVTLASREEAYAIAVQTSLSSPWFRCYTASDVVGVEFGGALKNVIAIAVGISDGMQLGQNARAATMTRGLREITRLAVKMGADPITFLGLSGMGDLVLTCCGDLSRNRQVGLELGRGKSLDEIIEGMNQVAEGIRTTRAAAQLGEKWGVEMPITEMVRDVLDGRLPATPENVQRLMTRQLRSEAD